MAAVQPVEVFHQLLEERSKPFAALTKELREGRRAAVLENLPGSALPFVLAHLLRSERRPILVLTAGRERAEDLTGDFEFFGIPAAYHYPKWEVLPYDDEDLSLEITAKTLDVLEAIIRRRLNPEGEPFVVCAPVDAMMLRVMPESHVRNLTVRIVWGQRLDTQALGEQLTRAGYTREPIVEARGEFSIRGGIVDIFPLNRENPIRIDLFGDEIESIRTFDSTTQRSLEDLGTEADLIVPPARLKSQIMGHLKAGGELVSIFDLLPEDTLVVLETPERFNEVCTYFHGAVERQYEHAIKTKQGMPKPAELLISVDEMPKQIDRFRRLEHSPNTPDPERKARHIEFPQAPYQAPAQELDSWLAQIRKLQHQDILVAVVCDNDGQVQRFDELLREHEISAIPVYEKGPGVQLKSLLSGYQEVLVMVGAVQTGFHLPDVRLCVMTDREIFGRYKRRYVYKKIYKGKPVHSTNEIRRSDFVVHVDHGIGQFLGMRVQAIDGRNVELIEILYSDDDKLLVPVEKIHKVQKYAGPESAQPSLDKLGSAKWAKRRKKHSEEIERLAMELLALYANRAAAHRPPHPADTSLQREFEASFLYQETPDQLKAIVDTKADMEKVKPMDRLVCGDVGYGKTEVAIRALFKCVQSGRQAAVLCPTTILAQQHFNNFRERFADYPVKVEMISRFKKPAEIKETKKKLKSGELNIVVGTHGLLAKDVEFKDLGLVVVDEEQRFGVRAKDRLKEMRTEVDILTLSATPIPRTLHMALSGIRDLSLITTPPPDRQPIKTKIISFEPEEIAEAILRELNRGGQVYFIHNRVKTIHEVAKRLQEIVPHARITVAHGQMDEEELENTMLQFIDRQFDILIATTIIESGVDIPNCNTIVINRADAFGLAQLYQLRGRVGRERRRAYAYLIVPQGQAITEAAVKRLAAIEEFAELGVGFSIAMRDLEIRGAGDLLGKAQHGTITEIGFELFCELLEEKVRELGGKTMAAPFYDVEVRWDQSSLIPPPFMPMESQRVTFYKRFADARTDDELTVIETEIRDRFGNLPHETVTMVDIYRLRVACQPLHIAGVKKGANKVRLTLIDPIAREIVEKYKAALKLTHGEVKDAMADTSDQIVLTLSDAKAKEGGLPLLRDLLHKVAVGK